MASPDDIYKIGLTKLPLIGSVLAKNLVSYCGGAKAVFETSKAKLLKIPGIGEKTAEAVVKAKVLKEAEEELKALEKQNVRLLFYHDKDYPYRLRFCADGPALLYYKGTADLNKTKVISIVGTRNNTRYGEEVTEMIVEELAGHDVLIVSGMAYGIDIISHRAALRNGLDTVGVFAHGLDQVYPYVHRGSAEKMLEQGGLLSEFPFNTRPDRENFPQRNRIVAGIADAVIVVETAVKGGSMITASIANSYSREVFAIPGPVKAKYSIGCNHLIRTNRAICFESTEAFLQELNWQGDAINPNNAPPQMELFADLEGPEKVLVEIIRENTMAIDELVLKSGLKPTIVSSTLLELEFKGLVKPLPGKMYKLKSARR